MGGRLGLATARGAARTTSSRQSVCRVHSVRQRHVAPSGRYVASRRSDRAICVWPDRGLGHARRHGYARYVRIRPQVQPVVEQVGREQCPRHVLHVPTRRRVQPTVARLEHEQGDEHAKHVLERLLVQPAIAHVGRGQRHHGGPHVLRGHVVQPTVGFVEHAQRDHDGEHVLVGHIVQPTVAHVERGQREGHELYVRTRRVVQPTVGFVEHEQRGRHELYVQTRTFVQPTAGFVEHEQRGECACHVLLGHIVQPTVAYVEHVADRVDAKHVRRRHRIDEEMCASILDNNLVLFTMELSVKQALVRSFLLLAIHYSLSLNPHRINQSIMVRTFMHLLQKPAYTVATTGGLHIDDANLFIVDDPLKLMVVVQMKAQCTEQELGNILPLQTTQEAREILSSSKYVAVSQR